MGKGTDTVAAVAGGLAGLYYGYESIPGEWLSVIARQEYVEGLCGKLYNALYDKSLDRNEELDFNLDNLITKGKNSIVIVSS